MAAKRDVGLQLVLDAAGGISALARIAGVNKQAVFSWKRVPPKRVLKIEAATKIPRYRIRPDIYPRERRAV